MRTKIIHYVCLLVAVLLSASCVYDKDTDGASVSNGKVQVKFTIAMDPETRGSRAGTWGDTGEYETEALNRYENTIEPGKLQVALYTDKGELIGEVGNISYIRHTDDDSYYDVVGDLPQGIAEGPMTCKILVLANYDTPATLTDKKLDGSGNIEFAYDYESLKAKTKYIPMWGIHTVSLDIKAGTRSDAGNIDMLRAMAKVRVKFSGDVLNDYTVKSVTLSHSRSNGYIDPTGFATVGETTGLDRDKCFHENTDGEEKTNLSFIKTDDEGYIIYVPEYKASAGTKPTIDLTLKDNKTETEQDYHLYFRGYENGAPTSNFVNIVRNTIFEYNITAVNRLKIEFCVLPWNLVETNIGWDVKAEMLAWGSNTTDATEEGGGDAEGVFCVVNYPRYANSKHTATEDARSGAAYSLKITAPEGAVWKAYLSNPNDFQFNYGTYNDAYGVRRHCASTGIARNEPYQIKVEAKNAWRSAWEASDYPSSENPYWVGKNESDKGAKRSGPVTDLYITVSLDGVHYYRVKINPKEAIKDNSKTWYYDGCRFAGSETEIRIWQVKALLNKNFQTLVGYNTDNTFFNKNKK